MCLNLTSTFYPQLDVILRWYHSSLDLRKPPPIPLNIPSHFRELLIKLVRNGPILQIPMIAFEQWGRIVRLCDLVEEEGVFEAKRPVKTQVLWVVV